MSLAALLTMIAFVATSGLCVLMILWLRWSMVSAYVFWFFVADYLGIGAFLFGYHPQTVFAMSMAFSESDAICAAWIAIAGLVAIFGGVIFLDFFTAQRRRGGLFDAHGINTNAVTILFAFCAAMVFFSPFGNVVDIYKSLHDISAISLYLGRKEAATNLSRITTAVNYPMVTVAALFVVALFKQRKVGFLLAVAAVAIAALAKFIYMMKMPFLLFLIQVGLFFVLLHGIRFGRLIFGAVFLFALLVGLYYLTLPIASQPGAANLLVTLAAERIVLRDAGSYLAAAHLIPGTIPHGGFATIDSIARLFGWSSIDLSALLFAAQTQGEQGNMAVPHLAWLYAAFGWSGVVIGGAITGAFFRALDMLIPEEVTPMSAALFSSLMIIPFWSTGTNLIGALVGYGGLISLFMTFLFTYARVPSPAAASVPAPAE